MVRGRKPRFDLAEQRIAEVLKLDPGNTEVQLLKAELMVETKADAEAIQAVYAEAEEKAPTPEAFHAEATWHQLKPSGRGRAAAALERGAQRFADSGRLRRRLAGVYIDQNRMDDAVAMLKEAMALEPMMPDTYGLLGEVYLSLGNQHLADAEAAIGEARRLDPENTLHMARLGALLMERAAEDDDAWKQAEELLSRAVEGDGRNYAAHLYLGRLIVERQGDLERADWLLKKASKLEERAAMPLVERARVALRRGLWPEAEALLDRAVKVEPGCHPAFAARGELFEARGDIFNADQAWRQALERSPKDSHGRARYEAAIARCVALIGSGAAVELQKRAEVEGAAAPAPAERRDPGTTTKRRRRRGARAGAEPAGAGVDGGGDGQVDAAAQEATAPEVAAGGEPAPSEAPPVEVAEPQS
jgi:Tfp pilus assembly protein PilF